MSFVFSLTIAQENSQSKNRIRVLSFNILHGATTQGTYDLDYIAKVISDTKPDLVALQEVDFKTDRTDKRDIATELALRTKMVSIFARAMDYNNGEYGVALLSKFSFSETANHALPSTPDYEPRTLATASSVLPFGDSIRLFGTHLDYHGDNQDRMAQVKVINALLDGQTIPSILAGDLNDVPGSTPITVLESRWSATYDPNNIEHTFHSDAPEKKIDYVMFYPKTAGRSGRIKLFVMPLLPIIVLI